MPLVRMVIVTGVTHPRVGRRHSSSHPAFVRALGRRSLPDDRARRLPLSSDDVVLVLARFHDETYARGRRRRRRRPPCRAAPRRLRRDIAGVRVNQRRAAPRLAALHLGVPPRRGRPRGVRGGVRGLARRDAAGAGGGGSRGAIGGILVSARALAVARVCSG